MRRVVPKPRSPFCQRVALIVAALAVFGGACGCGVLSTGSPPETGTSTPEAVSITDTQISGDQLVRVTGKVVGTETPGCLLLDTGSTTYLLIGGDANVLEPDETVTVTGNANPDTPTACTGGTPLVVSEAVPAD